MENSNFSVALIRKTENLTLRWMARLNPQTLQLEFVIGQRLVGESYREAVTREIAWELRLDRKRDFLVSNTAQLNLEFVDRLPGQFEKTVNQVSFYNVVIYRKQVIELLQEDTSYFWVNSDEICNGVTHCGRRFNPLVPYLINRSEVIQSWESFSGN